MTIMTRELYEALKTANVPEDQAAKAAEAVAMAADTPRRLEEMKTDVTASFARVDDRFDKVDERFDKVDARFDKLEASVDARFNKVDKRFDKMDARFDKMDARFDKMDTRLGSIDRRLSEVGADKLIIRWGLGLSATILFAIALMVARLVLR